MLCPRCGGVKTKAVFTQQNGGTTKRIRCCLECDYSFNTVERPEIKTFSEDEKKEYEEYLNGETVG